MKRIEALAPLSRDHHQSLILAQLLMLEAPEYKGMPTTPLDKAQYAFDLYNQKIKSHFEKEELLLKKVRSQHDDLEPIIDEIFQEHLMLTKIFISLPGASELEAKLDVLGHLLSKHIRKEERVLFPQIQETCSQELLNEIHDLTH